MRLKRLISAFITCAMLVTLMPMQAFAAPKDLNDTEFHIMQMDEIKNFVREANNLFNDADIKIYGINVHGLDKNGKPATVNGNITDWTKWNTTIGDLGWQGSNGKLANDDWMVLNINGITVLDQSSVDSITIFAKNDKNQLTTTAYLGEGDLHAPTQVSGKLITEIYLNNATPVPQFTLTYDANGGTGEIASQTYSEGTEVSVISVEEAKKVISRDEATLLGFSETPTEKSPITTATEAENVSLVTSVTMNQPIILYAVWAEDKNKNGKPDYSETKYTVTYKDGADGAVFKDFVTSNLLEGDPTPSAPEVPEREGYDFGGWTPEPEAIVEGAKHDIIYTAQWKPKPVAEKVTFIYNAGENGKLEDGAEPTKVYDVNDTGKYPLEAPAVIANPGYVFVNWQLPAGLTFDASTGNVLVTGAVAGQTYTITAQYQKDESSIKELSYKVEYYVDGTLKAVKEFKENIWAGTDTLTVTEDNLDNSFGILHTTTPALPADVKNGDAIQAYYYSDSNKDGIADMNQIHIIFKVDAEKGNMTGNEDFWWTWDENKPVEVALNAPVITAKDGYTFTGWACEEATVTEEDGVYYLTDYTVGRTYILKAQFEEVVTEQVRPVFVYKYDGKQVGEMFSGLIMSKGVHNFSEIIDQLKNYAPEGYKVVSLGDFYADQDVEVTVEVEPTNPDAGKTLRIHWAIDNPEAASWKLYEGNARTETIAWADRNNFLVMPEVDVKEGYKLNGWSVSGTEGQMWGADIVTFRLGDELIVKDDDNTGGDISITANIVSNESSDVIMNIRFMYGDEFVAGGDYFIPEGVQNYSILEKYVPEGYRMAVSGDFMAVNGGKLDVPLEKIDAETVPVTIQYFHGKDLVKEVHREMTEGVHSYRELEQDVPEGYTMAVAGDFYAKKDAVIVVDLTKEEVAEYKVTVNGSYANNSGEGKYAPGETVTIKAGTRDNYSFDGWESDDVDFEDADDSTTTFIMPAWDVTVRATWDRDSGGGAHHPDAGDDNDDDNDRDDDTEEIIDEEVPLAETPWLNTEDHYAYVVGYSEDGTVRPNANITRAEVATIFFRLLTDNARDQFWMTSNNFSDVLPNDWYNNAVSTMVNMGIIQGYEDGTFRPNANITRAEFAAIAARFMASGYEVEDDLFGDIAAHWARESINDAAMAGWINGYEDGTFRPDAAITRAEAVTMANNVLGRKPDADHMLDSMIKWTDNMDTSAWYYEAIQEATNSHDYDLFEDAEYETWTALQENRDWSALEKDWANAHVA